MQAAYDPRSRSCLQPRLQPMHSGRPPLRPCTVPAKTSFSPIPRIHDGGECQHNENTQTLPFAKPADVTKPSKRGRPTIGDKPMTAAERMRTAPHCTTEKPVHAAADLQGTTTAHSS